MICLYHFLYKGKTRAASLALCGKAALKQALLDLLCHARTGIIDTEQQAACSLSNADGDFTRHIRRRAAHGIKRVFYQIAEHGNHRRNRHKLSVSI